MTAAAQPVELSEHQHAVHFPSDKPERSSSSSPYVFLSNLPVDAYEGTIRQAFEQEGFQVATIELMKKGSFNRRRNAGLATVKLASAADAQRCCELLQGKVLHAGGDTAYGRPLIVSMQRFECNECEKQLQGAGSDEES